MRLKLKYYKVIAVFVLTIICLASPFIFFNKITMSSSRDIITLIFIMMLLIYVLINLGRMILFQFYEVEFSQTSIRLKNIITRKETFIETYISKFKINPVTGKLSLIDNEGDLVVELNAFNYFNIPEALEYLNLKRK